MSTNGDAPKTSMQERAHAIAYEYFDEPDSDGEPPGEFVEPLTDMFVEFASAEVAAATKDLQWQLDEVLRERDADIAFDVEAAEQRGREAGLREAACIAQHALGVGDTAKVIQHDILALLPEVNREP